MIVSRLLVSWMRRFEACRRRCQGPTFQGFIARLSQDRRSAPTCRTRSLAPHDRVVNRRSLPRAERKGELSSYPAADPAELHSRIVGLRQTVA